MNVALIAILSGVFIFYYFVSLILYSVHLARTDGAVDDTPLADSLRQTQVILGLVLTPLLFGIWAVWEWRYGVTFSLLWSTDAATYVLLPSYRRLGVLLQTALIGLLVTLILDALLTSDFLTFLEINGIPLLSRVSTLTILLIPVALFMPLLVLAIYATTLQFYIYSPNEIRQKQQEQNE